MEPSLQLRPSVVLVCAIPPIQRLALHVLDRSHVAAIPHGAMFGDFAMSVSRSADRLAAQLTFD